MGDERDAGDERDERDEGDEWLEGGGVGGTAGFVNILGSFILLGKFGGVLAIVWLELRLELGEIGFRVSDILG